jgi:hypothetical protein
MQFLLKMGLRPIPDKPHERDMRVVDASERILNVYLERSVDRALIQTVLDRLLPALPYSATFKTITGAVILITARLVGKDMSLKECSGLVKTGGEAVRKLL